MPRPARLSRLQRHQGLTLLDVAVDSRLAAHPAPPQGTGGMGEGPAHRIGSPVPTAVALVAVVSVAFALLSVTQPARSATHQGAGPAKAAPLIPSRPAGPVPMVFGGLRRSYLLEPAVGLPPGTAAALLVVLHQDGAVAKGVAASLGFDAVRRRGITVVYPSGYGGTWNAGACCGPAQRSGVDDVGFVNAVINDVGRQTPIDPRRRALLGYSGGAMLMYRILCSAHPGLAAAVDVNGSLVAPCPGAVALPDLLALHGARDATIRLNSEVYVGALRIAPRSILSTLAVITGSGGCAARRSRQDAETTVMHWAGCRGGTSVDAVLVRAAGHDWQAVGGARRTFGWLLAHLARRQSVARTSVA